MVVSTPVPKMQVVFTPGCSSRVTFTTFSNMACPCAEFFLLHLDYTIHCREYQSVCPSVRIGFPRSLSHKRGCPPLLKPKRGEGNTRLAGEGAGPGQPIRTTGEKAWHSVSTLCCHRRKNFESFQSCVINGYMGLASRFFLINFLV